MHISWFLLPDMCYPTTDHILKQIADMLCMLVIAPAASSKSKVISRLVVSEFAVK